MKKTLETRISKLEVRRAKAWSADDWDKLSDEEILRIFPELRDLTDAELAAVASGAAIAGILAARKEFA